MTFVITTLIVIGAVLGGILGACSYLIYIERKLAAYVQDRVGPNRVGPAGLLQPIADGLKFLLKEDVIPDHVDKALFLLAPAIAVMTTMLAFAVVPFGPTSLPDPSRPAAAANESFQFVIAPRVDIGIVFLFAVGSLAVYAVVLGGWASNNKYSFLGCLRASAQVISYEIPLGMSVLGVILLTGTLNLERIIQFQADGGLWSWLIWSQPLAALLFFISALAENNRLPFDLSECEQELVGGYHTEYSALKFALFFLAEYTHMITISFLVSVLFLGGWHFPIVAEANSSYFLAPVVKFGVLGTKVLCVIIVIMLLRWTLPRFRYDQLMSMAWQTMIPLSLLNLLCVMIFKELGLRNPLWLLTSSWLLFVGAASVSYGWISAKDWARRQILAADSAT